MPYGSYFTPSMTNEYLQNARAFWNFLVCVSVFQRSLLVGQCPQVPPFIVDHHPTMILVPLFPPGSTAPCRIVVADFARTMYLHQTRAHTQIY